MIKVNIDKNNWESQLQWCENVLGGRYEFTDPNIIFRTKKDRLLFQIAWGT
jgi:hypothetical protein